VKDGYLIPEKEVLRVIEERTKKNYPVENCQIRKL